MLRHGKRFKPVLLSGKKATPMIAPGVASTASAEQLQFRVGVAYTLTTGSPAVYSGRFYATSAVAAETTAREFVTKYLRPKMITNVVVEAATAQSASI